MKESKNTVEEEVDLKRNRVEIEKWRRWWRRSLLWLCASHCLARSGVCVCTVWSCKRYRTCSLPDSWPGHMTLWRLGGHSWAFSLCTLTLTLHTADSWFCLFIYFGDMTQQKLFRTALTLVWNERAIFTFRDEQALVLEGGRPIGWCSQRPLILWWLLSVSSRTTSLRRDCYFVYAGLVNTHETHVLMRWMTLLRLVSLSELKSARPFLKVPPSVFFKMQQNPLEEEKPRGCWLF